MPQVAGSIRSEEPRILTSNTQTHTSLSLVVASCRHSRGNRTLLEGCNQPRADLRDGHRRRFTEHHQPVICGISTAKVVRLTYQWAMVYGRPTILKILLKRTGCTTRAQDAPSKFVVDAIFSDVIHPDKPGAAVLIAKMEVLFEQRYGLADLERRDSTTIKHGVQYCIHYQAIHRGGCHPEAAGGRSAEPGGHGFEIIPDYPRGDEIKIRHLLTHTLGIPDKLGWSGLDGDGATCTGESGLPDGAIQICTAGFRSGSAVRLQQLRIYLLGHNNRKGFGSDIFRIFAQWFFGAFLG